MFYFPIILNIFVLTHATRFDGTRIVTLMLLANLFLLVWDYDRLKNILKPADAHPIDAERSERAKLNASFARGLIVRVLRDRAARNSDDTVIFSKRGRDVEAGETNCGSPHNGITVAEDCRAALLNVRIGEEGAEAFHTGPEVHDQELASAFGKPSANAARMSLQRALLQLAKEMRPGEPP